MRVCTAVLFRRAGTTGKDACWKAATGKDQGLYRVPCTYYLCTYYGIPGGRHEAERLAMARLLTLCIKYNGDRGHRIVQCTNLHQMYFQYLSPRLG